MAGRQKSWLKIKCSLRQEFIILGFSDARTGGRALGAGCCLGYKKNGALRYAGKVGTGFSMKSARELAERFAGMTVEKPTLSRTETDGLSTGEWNAVHWIKPSLLCEVAFTEWTPDRPFDRDPYLPGTEGGQGCRQGETGDTREDDGGPRRLLKTKRSRAIWS